MKRHYRNSRSHSNDRRKGHHRSTSRSRQKANKKSLNKNSSRQNHRVSLAKIQSDIKNHFRFKLPNLNSSELQETIKVLKSKLNEHIGPVQHITGNRQSSGFNLGFKYDIDALSFLQTGNRLTVKVSSQKIYLEPIPTKVFEYIINERHSQHTLVQRQQKKSYQKKHESKNKRSRSKSYSSSSSSKKNSYRSDSASQKSTIKLQIYGIPAQTNQQKVLSCLKNAPGGSYKILKSSWKVLNGSVCQYYQIRIDSEKGDKLLEISHRIQIDGRPVVIVQQNQRPGKELQNFQIQIHFPKPVFPSKVLKYIQSHVRVVQIVATQQLQQDGKCRGFIVTVNDASVASSFKKLGVSEPRHGQYVYRPIVMLPPRHQL